jgi:hypothetical protein
MRFAIGVANLGQPGSDVNSFVCMPSFGDAKLHGLSFNTYDFKLAWEGK